MLPFMLISLLPLIAIRLCVYEYFRKHFIKTNVCHEVLFFLFALTLVGVSSQTVFNSFEAALTQGRINLVPFASIAKYVRYFMKYGLRDIVSINLIGNIAVFIPFGLFPPLLWRKFGFFRTIMLGASISALYEIIQLGQNRTTDIDDLILNTLGTAVGFLLYLLIKSLPCKVDEKCKLKSATGV
jgi:glycopeptide antibiotics resistance protein